MGENLLKARINLSGRGNTNKRRIVMGRRRVFLTKDELMNALGGLIELAPSPTRRWWIDPPLPDKVSLRDIHYVLGTDGLSFVLESDAFVGPEDDWETAPVHGVVKSEPLEVPETVAELVSGFVPDANAVRFAEQIALRVARDTIKIMQTQVDEE